MACVVSRWQRTAGLWKPAIAAGQRHNLRSYRCVFRARERRTGSRNRMGGRVAKREHLVERTSLLGWLVTTVLSHNDAAKRLQRTVARCGESVATQACGAAWARGRRTSTSNIRGGIGARFGASPTRRRRILEPPLYIGCFRGCRDPERSFGRPL
jgi:hypothetical protein